MTAVRVAVLAMALGSLLPSTPACRAGPTDIVGPRDCDRIVQTTRDPATIRACRECAGRPCRSDECRHLPCLSGRRILRTCADDADCSEFDGALCGRFSAPDSICSTLPDDR